MRLMLAAIGIGLVACSDALPVSPTDLDRLDLAEHQWAARSFANYSIDMSHVCDCPPSFRDRARIDVVGGTVRQVKLLGTLAVITDSRIQRYRTVEDVFRDIRNATRKNGYLRVTFTLDPVLGVPTYVHWAARSNAPELELILQISNPQPLSSFPPPR